MRAQGWCEGASRHANHQRLSARGPFARLLSWPVLLVLWLAWSASPAMAADNAQETRPKPRSLRIVLIPGDSLMLASVNAVKQLKAEPAYAGLRFDVLPQSLLDGADLARLAQADLVLARHMVGSAGEATAAAMQAVAARRGRLYGIGQNEGASARLGLAEDPALRAYADAGGAENLAHMLRLALQRDFGFAPSAAPPRELPQAAAWDIRTGRLYEDVESYLQAYLAARPARPAAPARPWVGLVVNRGQATGGGDENVAAIAAALERRGFNVLPVYGFPSTLPVERFFIDGRGQARVAAVVALAMKLGNVPDRIGPALARLDVPLVNGIVLYKATRAEWEASPLGLDHAERSWQVGGPEFAGIVAPTVVATKERRTDPATGLQYIAEVPIPERVARLADRVRKLVDLRLLAERDKRVALLYYNYPPGRENVGASYLNVMPRSLWQIMARLEAEGYDTQGRPAHEKALFDRLREHGVNVADTKPGALAALVAGGQAVLWPVADYRRHFDALPAVLRESMTKSWGRPEDSATMVWRDRSGRPFFVFPVQRFGKLLFAPQPVRGWGDPKKMYHDVLLPPPHQYLAFYLWLQREFKAHAMVHVGTHGTHEWLPGKEVGFSDTDWSEVMVADVPQVYPYSVDVVGEGLQAKRRGMAAVVSHMTPPFDKAGLNPDLVTLHGLFDDHGVARQQSVSATAANLVQLEAQARKMGLLKDIGLTALRSSEDVDALHDHLHDIELAQTPMGLHTFGVAPEPARRAAIAEAMVDRMSGVTDPFAEEAAIAGRIEASARAELDALVAALDGRYVAAGVGGDPLRSPGSLPTGKNFYGFDPARIPTPAVYEQGAAMAAALLADHRRRHGAAPQRLMFNLWSGETMRHGGVLESQILALMGVKPTWDHFGRVSGIEVVPRAQLGRPRVDVVITPSGLYRDALPQLMQLLDRAMGAVKDLPEDDNPIRHYVQSTRQALEARGVEPALAERLASVRQFTDPPGAYGTGLDNVVRASNTWSAEAQVAEVYFKRMGHLYGQGFWGDRPVGSDGQPLAIDVFKSALQGVQAVLHSSSSNVYGTLDNDDVFQFLGGAALAVRQVSGTSPETLIVNLAEPGRERVETLDRAMGREMRARYLNPAWIDAMLNEGYAGARLISQVVDNLWGWQVTAPEVVDAAKWQEMFETYVQDKHRLDIRRRFTDAKNALAYQALVDRMLVAVNKGYWQPGPEVRAALAEANRQAIAEAGVACDRTSCSSDDITRLAGQLDRAEAVRSRGGYGMAGAASPPVAAPAQAARAAAPRPDAPAAAPAPSPTRPPPDPVVMGQQLVEVPRQAPAPAPLAWAHAAWMALLLAAGFGWQAWQARHGRRQRRDVFTSSNQGVPA
jgi:cobaltochelatase CobN